MRPYTQLMLTATAALLTACGGSGPVAEEANDTAVLPAIANAAAAPPAAASDGSAPANAVAAGPEPLVAAATIPSFLHGRWGLSPTDCISTSGDTKGLIVIGPGEMRFYESRAVPVANPNGSDNSFSADFAFTGEGQSWTRFQTLQLQDKRLVRTESNPMASYTYAKCS